MSKPTPLACPICGEDRYIIDGYLVCWHPHGCREKAVGVQNASERAITPNKKRAMLVGVKEGVRMMQEQDAKDAKEKK